MIVTLLSILAVTSAVVAFYKHKTLSGVVTSAKKEVAYLEAFAKNIPTEAKTEYDAIVARLKAIF